MTIHVATPQNWKKKTKENSNFSQLFHEIMTISLLFHEIVTIFTFISVPYPPTSRKEFQSYQRKNTQIAVMDPEHFKTLCYNLQKYFEYNSRVTVSNHLHQHAEFKTQTLKFFYSEKIFNSPWRTLSIFLSLVPQEKAILGMKTYTKCTISIHQSLTLDSSRFQVWCKPSCSGDSVLFFFSKW